MACFASKSWASFYNVAIFSKRFQQVRNKLVGTSFKQWKQSLQQKSAKTVAATIMLVTGHIENSFNNRFEVSCILQSNSQDLQPLVIYRSNEVFRNWTWLFSGWTSVHSMDKPRELKRGRMSREKDCKKIALISNPDSNGQMVAAKLLLWNFD